MEITDVAEVPKNIILGQSTNVSSWTDFQGKSSYMFYVLGPLDAELFEEKPAAAVEGGDSQSVVQSVKKEKSPQEKAAERIENQTVHFGRVYADPIELSKLH